MEMQEDPSSFNRLRHTFIMSILKAL